MVRYAGLSKAEVLMQLYNFAKYDLSEKSVLDVDLKDMKLYEAEKLIKENLIFTKIKDKIINVDLQNNISFDETYYDEINGIGTAQHAVDTLVIAKIQNNLNNV